MKGHIGMQIEITLSERLKHLMQDQETMSSQLKNLKEHLSQLDQSNKGRMDEYKKRLDGTLQKLKTEFTFKQNESEKTYMQSFNDIRQIAMPMPFNPPSQVLFELLGWLDNAAKGVVTTAEEIGRAHV